MEKQMTKNEHLEGTVEEFVEKNIRLVHFVAQKYAGVTEQFTGIEYDDIVSIGTIGFLQAYSRYNPVGSNKGIEFSTYAVSYIRGHISRFFRDTASHISYPRSVKDANYKIQILELRDNTAEEISEKIGVSLKTAKAALTYNLEKNATYLDTPITGDGNVTLGETLSCECDMEDSIIASDFLNLLNENHRDITKLWMQGMSQLEIGEALGTSQAQVSRILKRVMSMAKQYGDGVKMEKSKADFKKAERLVAEGGMTIEQISKASGVSVDTVSRYRRKLKLSKEVL